MVNSTMCPICKDGIGHAMDDSHAELVKEMLETIRFMANGVHQAYHESGVWQECRKTLCDAARQVITKVEVR